MLNKEKGLTPDQVRERRKYFLDSSLKITKSLKGSSGVDGTRFCVVCQTPLTTVILPTGKPKTIRSHYRCRLNNLITVSMCLDSRVCQREHKKRRDTHAE